MSLKLSLEYIALKSGQIDRQKEKNFINPKQFYTYLQFFKFGVLESGQSRDLVL